MQHPLEFIPQHLRKPLFYVFLTLTLLVFSVFRSLDAPLRTDSAPGGIVSFELAWTADAAREILDSWDAKAHLNAAFGLGLDYLFMPVYGMALSLGLLLISRAKGGWFRRLAAWMGWGALAAALFDAIENYALWRELTGLVVSPYPEIAALCAQVKFALLIAGILVALMGGFVRSN